MTSKIALAGVGAAVIGAFLMGRQSTATVEKATAKDPTDLLEFSVVYTDRATNLMSSKFCQTMRDLSAGLKEVYNADALALIPGSGSYAMEATARQFGRNKKVMVLRNGYFSFRWTDIFDQSQLVAESIVLKGQARDSSATPQFGPHPIADVVARIAAEKPAVVFAPHIETSTGIILSDDYIKAVTDAVHQYGGFFVLDCIASGTIWTDMKALGVDLLITAPQKGWTAPASVGIVMMNQRAKDYAAASDVNGQGSMALNLKKWLEVMDKYEAGAFMYYTTLPTDALMTFRDAMLETKAFGFAKSNLALRELGTKIRALLAKYGYKSVAADDCPAPGVVVAYADNKAMVGKFKAQGVQIAGGVPFKIDEPEGLMTFRLGLFGLDKIADVDATVATFEKALIAVHTLNREGECTRPR